MNARVFEFASAPPIPATGRSEFNTWCEGFDACTNAERGKQTTVSNPYIGAQGAQGAQGELWQAGFAASKRVTEIGEQAA